MKKYLSLRYLTSLSFLILLGVMFAQSMRPCFYIAYNQLQSLRAGNGISIATIEAEYQDGLPGKHKYITLNGGFQRLLGIRNVNERYRMNNGHLTYVVPEMDVTELAENTVTFRDDLEALGIPYGYISTPFKVAAHDKQLPLGVEDYANENTDRFLEILEENGVSTLDLRDKEVEQGLDHYSLYYVTDHHWKAEMGFWAFGEITSWLEEQDGSYAVDPALKDPENYDHTVHEDIFCGSAARRIGPWYAGLDDLTVITPKFDSYLHFDAPDSELYREGNFEEALLFPEYLSTKNMMETSAYGVYLGEDYSLLRLTNDSRQLQLPHQSAPKKLLILKDSNSLVVAPFLALSYDEICLIDLRLFERNLMDYIREYQPDMVLTIYNPGAMEAHNSMMFHYKNG